MKTNTNLCTNMGAKKYLCRNHTFSTEKISKNNCVGLYSIVVPHSLKLSCKKIQILCKFYVNFLLSFTQFFCLGKNMHIILPHGKLLSFTKVSKKNWQSC